MSAYFEHLEQDLVAAASRQAGIAPAPAWRRRRPWAGLLLATLLCVGAGAATAGGTLLVLRGSVIPAPAARDVPVGQLPVPGTSRLAAARAADPRAGIPEWALRVARGRTGLLCGTVGQLEGGTFGLVGLDGRFRRLDEGAVDSCGEPRRDAASLVGVRVFDASRRDDVRSVVYGVAGPELRGVDLVAGGRTRKLPVAAGGTFLAAFARFPEDLGIALTLRFADGHSERHALGTSAWVVPDPGSLGAWTTEVGVRGTAPGRQADSRTCVSFHPARERSSMPVSPPACGDDGGARRARGWFFLARRVAPAGVPARTAVWGLANPDVRTVELLGPGAERRRLVVAPSRAFLAVLSPDVDPARLRVRATFADGRVETATGSAHLVEAP